MAFNYEINQLELMQARIKSVPHGWQFTYVGKAFCIRNNLRKPISEEERSMSPGNYPYYGPTKIQGYIGTFEQDGSYALIGEDGDHFLKFEKHSMTQLVDGKCTVNNHAHIIEGTKEASREWFYYYFMHRDIFSFLSRQGAGRYKLNKASLEKMPLLLPPIVEQKKIAQILSTWDKAISVTEKLLANSQQQKKALMQQLLTGKKRLLDENGVRFSGEWEYTIFGNLGDTYTGLTGKTKEDFGAGKPYIPYINIFKNSRIDIQNLEYVQVNDDERQSVVKYGDIFFTTSSETPEEVGMSSVLLEEVSEVFLNSFCFGFRLNNFETLIPKYARYLFRSEHVRRQISTLGQGATRYNLSKRQLIKLELKLPCVEEQQKIAAVLSAADAEISTLEKKLACLRDEKKALMQQLLTGKRRVKVDEAVAE
ncbi:restriction endonuclease subunit S [Escherichia coli]|uniref:restriction endonuclease subunit S n=1 Tax=Escherichia coli TaxID=562 RepID=UPI001D6781E3|nr:restriction endonuclease subunit S [Escherichia coli]EFO2311110.1 restriction endonuclease subunit S [Escherichia coli]HBJ0438639.1 restriction endonuclease subunit S [Escherichia coli]HCO5159371.1 restriction endonuclease subunit S [Escherichia coli]